MANEFKPLFPNFKIEKAVMVLSFLAKISGLYKKRISRLDKRIALLSVQVDQYKTDLSSLTVEQYQAKLAEINLLLHERSVVLEIMDVLNQL